MTPGRYNFTCPQGTTLRTILTYKLDETPVDITGYSARLQVRETYESDEYIIELTNTNGGITLGGSAGTISSSIKALEVLAGINQENKEDKKEMVQINKKPFSPENMADAVGELAGKRN